MRKEYLSAVCLYFAYSLSLGAPVFKQKLHPVAATEAAPSQFEILRLVTKLEDRPPTLVETQDNLRVDDRRFSMDVTIRYTIQNGDRWVIGIIQQLDAPLINSCEYGTSILDWELPELPYCDCFSKLDAPWPGNLSYRIVSGSGTAEVFTSDHLVNGYNWNEPLPPKGQTYGTTKELVSVNRSQNFTDWLIACRESDGAVIVLKRILWGSSFKIAVQVNNFLGERATLMEDKCCQPIVEDVTDIDAVSTFPTKILSGEEISNRDMQWWSTPKADHSTGIRIRLK